MTLMPCWAKATVRRVRTRLYQTSRRFAHHPEPLAIPAAVIVDRAVHRSPTNRHPKSLSICFARSAGQPIRFSSVRNPSTPPRPNSRFSADFFLAWSDLQAFNMFRWSSGFQAICSQKRRGIKWSRCPGIFFVSRVPQTSHFPFRGTSVVHFGFP